jgi:hypothetical protein
MKNVFEESIKLLSKNDIIKKFSNIKTSRNINTKKNHISRNNYDLNLLSKRSKNLTYQNFHTEKNVKNILEKKRDLKNDLLSYSGYSSFNIKSTKNFKLNSDFPLTSEFSQNKMKIGKKYNRFSSSQNIIRKKNIENISYDRTKTSTTKITKTNNLNCNTSSNRNISGLLSPYSNKTNRTNKSNISNISNKFLNYRVKSCFLKTPSRNLNRESVSSFMEKTRIIRREKILKHELKHIYDNESEINKEKLFLFNKNKYDFQKYVSLFNIYYKSFNLYLKNLEMEKAKGNQICNQLIKQKIDLGLENQRIRHQINKLEIKKIRYKNLLDLLKSIKYGLNNSKTEIMSRNHITNKHKKISLSETNNNNKKNNFKKFFYINKIRRNSRNMNTNTFQQEKNQNKM